jgi:hypothetical protein
MNYQKFVIEDDFKIYSPHGNPVAHHITFTTFNQCIEYIDWLLKPFKGVNLNSIELAELIEDSGEEQGKSNWLKNEKETSLHNSTSNHYE